MRLTSRKKSPKLDMQMTSMIDCVFLLLIFFMVTSSFALTERELDPGIKVQRGGAAASDLAPAIVDVARSNAAGFVYRLGGREFAYPDDLAGVLRQFENKTQGAIVRAQDEAPFDMAASAIQACKAAGFAHVSYVPLPAANDQ
jgi:biopolymer transport protein ExbD